MSWDEIALKDIWVSLFRSDVCSKVKGFNNELVGPLMLIERTVQVFKELGQNYVNCLEDAKLFKTELDIRTQELNELKQTFNESQKLCDNCESLAKELSFAKKRAQEAESRVTQIAKILVVQSSDDVDEPSNPLLFSPSVSPKRKKTCLRNSNESPKENCSSSIILESEIASVPPHLPQSERENNFKIATPKKSPRSVNNKSPKFNLTARTSGRRLSTNAVLSDVSERVVFNTKRNLSAEFHSEPAINISPSKKNKRKESEAKKFKGTRETEAETVDPHGTDDSFMEYAKNIGSELDKLWFNDTEITKEYKPNGNVLRDDVPETNLPSSSSKTKEAKGEWKMSKKRRNTAKYDRMSHNSDSSFSIVFEKKGPKKKFKQLTLQVKPANRCPEESAGYNSDQDILLPSPKKEKKENQEEIDDLNGPFDPGSTSTQKPLDNSFDVILNKRKTTPSPNYKYKGKTVRGKAERAKLQGWDCEECKKFYELACKNLSPSKAKAKMNFCSRHRSKYNTRRPPTPPGFWDIDIPDTPE